MRVVRYIVGFLATLIAFAIDTTLMPRIVVLGGCPSLTLAVVFVIAMHSTPMDAILCGAFAGLLTDVMYHAVFGLDVLLYLYAAWLIFTVHNFVYSKNRWLGAVYTFAAVFLVQTLFVVLYFWVWGRKMPFLIPALICAAETALLVLILYGGVQKWYDFLEKKEAV